jgi:tetratricopeptide (TPR) repeat protein
VNGLILTMLGALLATNQPLAVSNAIAQETGLHLQVTNPNDPVEKEYEQLLSDDDKAQAEIKSWIDKGRAQGANDNGVERATLSLRIRQRLRPIRQAYEDFIRNHPDHARARIAFASFLDDLGDEAEEVKQLEKARRIDPTNPAIWNNLANYYGHRGPVTNAFAYYQKAIELDSNEPVYYQNLATTVYLFRKDAERFYHFTEQQVFDRALELYRKARSLNPHSFVLASDLAMSYYGIRPMRFAAAREAWNDALKIAHNDVEREGVYVHFARLKMMEGRLAEARHQLAAVTNGVYAGLKRQENRTKGTNAPPVNRPGPR